MQMSVYEESIQSLSNEIQNLQTELQNSNDKSLATITIIKENLARSEALLSESQTALEIQKQAYEKSLKGLDSLKSLLKIYKTSVIILAVITAVETLFIAVSFMGGGMYGN